MSELPSHPKDDVAAAIFPITGMSCLPLPSDLQDFTPRRYDAVLSV